MAEGGSQGTLVSGVAGRYATALFELASEAGQVDAVSAALASFEALIGESEDLARLIGSPAFTADEQVAAIKAVLEKAGIGGIAANFIGLVASKRRLFALPGMIAAYKKLVADAKGIVSAEVSVAEEPSAKRIDEIRAALKEVAGKDVDVAIKVDPSLIGGLVVKMGSRMVDASLKDVAGKDVDVAIKADPSLIGGLVVKMGSRMVDASLKTKLNSIRLAMKEVG